MYYGIMNFKLFFYFYFLNMDISLYNYSPIMQFCTDVDNTLLEGSVSQIFYLAPSFYFMSKNG